MNLTVKDVLLARERFAKLVDPLQTCDTCKHKDHTTPCNECFNSFIGIPFNPTKWERRA
jgi:recombinational DNA repair protein RecR